jgi:hypothetical protein
VPLIRRAVADDVTAIVALIAFAIEEARRRDSALVQLTTDKSRHDAHRFYERLGFAASHEGMKLDLRE